MRMSITYCYDVTVSLLVQFILDASLAVESYLHVTRLVLSLPVLHELYEHSLPLRSSLQTSYVRGIITLGVKVVNDDGHHHCVSFVILRILWEALALGDESSETVVRLDRTTPGTHAANVEFVAE